MSAILDVVVVNRTPVKAPFVLLCEQIVEIEDVRTGETKRVKCNTLMERISGAKDGHIVWQCRRREQRHIAVTCVNHL